MWEAFADVYQNYPPLKWSHFYVALNWDNAAECLQWADENQANVAEMRAWRRLQRGEDLTTQSELDQLADESLTSFVPEDPTLVRDPAKPDLLAEIYAPRRPTSTDSADTPQD